MLLYFYSKPNGRSPVSEYFDCMSEEAQDKTISYAKLLIERGGRLGLPYARHISGKVWELRVDYDRRFHRIFYFVFEKGKIVFLHGYDKKSNKAPSGEIDRATDNYNDFIRNLNYKTYGK